MSFLLTLARESLPEVLEVSRWQWIASSGFDLAPPIHHSRHQAWIRKKGHSHSPAHREVMFPLYGKKVFGLCGKVYRCAPGAVFLFDHYEARDWVASPWQNKESASVLWLHFFRNPRCYLTYNTVSQDGKGKVFREVSQRVYTGELVEKVMTAWDAHKAAPAGRWHWERLKALLTALLLDILEHTEARVPEGHQQKVIQAMQEYIATHLGEDLSLELLARVAGYSPYFFHRIFREYSGKTVKEFINQLRYEKACGLLRQSMSVASAAQALGFSSPYSFSRFFKAMSGVSPKHWRQYNVRPAQG